MKIAMAGLNPDNCVKLFRLSDSQDSTYPENVVIIPEGKSVFVSMFRSESRGWQAAEMEAGGAILSEEGINLLVKFRHELQELFLDCGDISGIAAVLWEDISRRLFERGFTISGKQCAIKWEALYSEYLEIAESDDEGRVSGCGYFAAFENLYKVRSKYIDSKIVEDITEYLSSRPECSSASNKTGSNVGVRSDEKIVAQKGLSRDDFSTLSNEDNSQMLVEAIGAAQKILEDNLKDSDCQTNEGTAQNVEDMRGGQNIVGKSPWRFEKSEKSGGETSLSVEQKDALKTETCTQSAEKKREDATVGCQGFMRSEKHDFYWDSDSTQCFLDLRLYVESNKETKQSVLRIYKSIIRFVSQKMLQNGFEVSEIDCKRKWEQLSRYYNREINKLKMKPEDQNRLQGVKTYFWQMDKVLNKSGLKMGEDNSQDFIWDQESIKKLIFIRMPMEKAFSMFKRYVILWQYVASQMQKYNYSPTYNECSIKWMEISEIYKICLESVRSGGAKEEDIGWNFYQDMRQGFDINARKVDAVINYSCNLGPGGQASTLTEREEKSAASSVPCTSSSGSLNTEQKQNCPNLQTGAVHNTLETAIQHCNILESMLTGVEVNATDNLVVESKGPEPSKIDNDTKIITLEDLYSLDSNGNLTVKPEDPGSSCGQGPEAPLLRFEDAFGVRNRFKQSYGTVIAPKVERVEATDSDETQSATRWTDEATSMMINLKLSRELKFRSSSYMDIDLWQEIATDMGSAGYSFSAESCSIHWNKLMEAHKNNPNSVKREIISPKNQEQLKVADLPLTKNKNAAKSPKSDGSSNDNGNSNGGKKLWNDHAVETLIRLKFSREIRHRKVYGLALAKKMQAAGFTTITHADIAKKWSSLHATYKKALIRKEAGLRVKWQYFKLMDDCLNGTTGDEEPQVKKKMLPFSWTPKSVQKLIDVRLMLEDCCRGHNHKDLKFLWMKVADVMVDAGFQVTHYECRAQWSFLVKAYIKTKQELRTGTGANISEYFIMMDKAMSEMNKLDSNEEDVEQPIDFSIGRNKVKLEGSGKDSTADVDQSFANMSFNENTSSAASQTISENEDLDQSFETIEENAINLTTKTAVPHLNYTAVDSSSEVTKMYETNKIYASSSVDSSLVSNPNKEKDISTSLIFKADRSQEKRVRGPLYTRASSCTNEMMENEDHVDSSKENLACTSQETRNKTSSATSVSREDTQLLDLQVFAPGRENVLTQGEESSLNRKWSEAGTHLLIDLKLEQNRKLDDGLSPEMKWEELSAQLGRLGHNYTAEECSEKWYSLETTYEQKIAEIQTNRTVQTWPYFQKMNTFHKQLENLYHGIRYILSKKRPHDGDEERLQSPKKMALCAKPLGRKELLSKAEKVSLSQEKIIQ